MAYGGHRHSAFATFLILCPTSFFLGILFSLFPYDYPLLWTAAEPPVSAFTRLESHLAYLHASPPIIPRLLHIVISTGLLGFLIKLYKPSESNLLFDGASLGLYMVALIVYITNIVKGLRVITAGRYDTELVEGESVIHSHLTGSSGSGGIQVGPILPVAPDEAAAAVETIGRDDSLRVLSASNTIMALVLVGVLVLQAGQWYAERKQGQEEEEERVKREERLEKRANAGASGGGGGHDLRHRSPGGATGKKKV